MLEDVLEGLFINYRIKSYFILMLLKCFISIAAGNRSMMITSVFRVLDEPKFIIYDLRNVKKVVLRIMFYVHLPPEKI